jgi:hypothetical protein
METEEAKIMLLLINLLTKIEWYAFPALLSTTNPMKNLELDTCDLLSARTSS